MEKIPDFVIRGLIEIFVPEAHGVERIRGEGTNDLIHFYFKFAAGFGRRHRDRDDDTCRLEPSNRDRGGAHAGTCCETVIHDDNDAAARIQRRAVAAVNPFAPLQFPLLLPMRRAG